MMIILMNGNEVESHACTIDGAGNLRNTIWINWETQEAVRVVVVFLNCFDGRNLNTN
jgi:hypothetical protein